VKLEFSRQIFEKFSNIRFHENPFSGNRFVLCGRTDMTKLIVAFRIFTKASKNAAFATVCVENCDFYYMYIPLPFEKHRMYLIYLTKFCNWLDAERDCFFISASLVIRTFIVQPPFESVYGELLKVPVLTYIRGCASMVCRTTSEDIDRNWV
jgi:hypothetical protein